MSSQIPAPKQRLDKWLWFARVVKSRTLAAKLVQGGYVRVNGDKAENASRQVSRADILTISLERDIRILKVMEPGMRRGPYMEACLLFEDLTPPKIPLESILEQTPSRDPGEGRPTKRDRRQLDRWMDEGK